MRTRLGLKVLGLSALLMSAMAIGTTGAAQAETGACWGYESVGGLKCFGGGLDAGATLTLENNTGTILIANMNLEILCTQIAFVEGGKLSANGSITLGRVQFSGCISLSKTPTLSKLNSCTPNDPVGGLGTLRTEKGVGLVVLHNSEPVLEIKPDSGTTMAKIFFGEECSIAEELVVTGKLILQDTGGKKAVETHALSHLLQEFTGLQLMKVGANLATFDGTANATLSAPHSELKWAAKPS